MKFYIKEMILKQVNLMKLIVKCCDWYL